MNSSMSYPVFFNVSYAYEIFMFFEEKSVCVYILLCYAKEKVQLITKSM